MSDWKELTEYLDSLESYVPDRELIVYKNHQKIYEYHSKNTDGNQLYLLYSSSKIATCVGALRLMEQGLLHLEDKVSDYLPEYAHLMVKDGETVRPAKEELLIRHLLTMCGGFSYERQTENLLPLKKDDSATTRDVVRAIAKEPLLFEPGTQFEYSLCHDILGGVIEVVSKRTLDTYLKEEIFLPLEMKDTTFHLSLEQKKRKVPHYVYHTDTQTVTSEDNEMMEYRLSPKYESGGAGIYSTSNDYIKLADALACGGTGWNGYEVLRPETVEMLKRNSLSEAVLKQFEQKMGHAGQGYGLGVMVLLDRKPRNWKSPEGVFNWGGAAGTKTFMDGKNQLSFYYAQEVMGGPACTYEEHQHNRIINMIYECLGGEQC